MRYEVIIREDGLAGTMAAGSDLDTAREVMQYRHCHMSFVVAYDNGYLICQLTFLVPCLLFPRFHFRAGHVSEIPFTSPDDTGFLRRSSIYS